MENLPSSDRHRFGFGKNWKDYSKVIDAERIATAEHSLASLLKHERLDGLTFLDIGSGSGLFSLAALNLGAQRVLAIDIDSDSVATTRDVLSTHAGGDDWDCIHMSVFDLDPDQQGQFDVVYSWGVLHHTGDLRGAIKVAARMVKEGGVLAVALYKRTRFCGFWRIEKRLYSSSPRFLQCIVRGFYKAAFMAGKLVLGENPLTYIRNYGTVRGMSWTHDVHDWLGGYPYESVDEQEMKAIAEEMGWQVIGRKIQPGGRGLLGTGCDEFLLQR